MRCFQSPMAVDTKHFEEVHICSVIRHRLVHQHFTFRFPEELTIRSDDVVSYASPRKAHWQVRLKSGYHVDGKYLPPAPNETASKRSHSLLSCLKLICAWFDLKYGYPAPLYSSPRLFNTLSNRIAGSSLNSSPLHHRHHLRPFQPQGMVISNASRYHHQMRYPAKMFLTR